MAVINKQEWIGHGLLNSDKSKRAREMHRELTGQNVSICKIQ